VAENFKDSFEIPMFHSPGAFFFGASLNPIDYGICDYPDNGLGVAGRGETYQQAFESCVGEACEFLSFLEHNNDPLLLELENCKELPSELKSWCISGLGFDDATMFPSTQFIEVYSLRDKSSSVVLPADLILRRPEERRIAKRQTESNGLGAGACLEDAILSGLLEVIERDAIALWWYGGNIASKISDNALDKTGIITFAKRIRNPDERNWWQLDITSDLEIPTVATISSNYDGSSVVMGFASGLTFEQAMRKSFLEMCQMELAQDISLSKLEYKSKDELQPKDLQWIERARHLNIKTYPELSPKQILEDIKSPELDSITDVVRFLSNKNFHPYFVNLTRQSLNIPVVKVLVPGLQSSKVDWMTQRLLAVAEGNNLLGESFDSKIAPL